MDPNSPAPLERKLVSKTLPNPNGTPETFLAPLGTVPGTFGSILDQFKMSLRGTLDTIFKQRHVYGPEENPGPKQRIQVPLTIDHVLLSPDIQPTLSHVNRPLDRPMRRPMARPYGRQIGRPVGTPLGGPVGRAIEQTNWQTNSTDQHADQLDRPVR